MERTPFTIATGCGELSGWVSGVGPRVLAIHGGPGMSFGYLDDAVEELAAQYQVATFQQRGLAPSTEQGEFTIAEAVADIAAVMDAAHEALCLVWGSYFAHPPAAPPMPHVEFSQPANLGLWTDLTTRLPELESSLRRSRSRSACS